jgi:hypothetical protein
MRVRRERGVVMERMLLGGWPVLGGRWWWVRLLLGDWWRFCEELGE